jgi:predicted transposase/invertase (TIGR01784 family)
VPIFVSRAVEPTDLVPYEPLLQSDKIKRIYLKDHPVPDNAGPGLAILQLVTAPLHRARELVARIFAAARVDVPSAAPQPNVIQLVEELMIRRFPGFSREEVRTMFELADLRKTRVWQEAHEEGIEKGIEEGEARHKAKMVHRCLDKGMSTKEIADLLELSVQEVRRLTKKPSD